MINSKDKINKLIKVVDNARKSGNVLVEVDQAGTVKVQSERQAIVLALAKKSNEKKLFTFSIILSSIVGLVFGMAIIGTIDYYKDIKAKDEASKFSMPISKVESELLSEVITELEKTENSAAFSKKSLKIDKNTNIDDLYAKWDDFIESLPDSYPVIVAGVYIGESLAFKAYQKLSPSVRTILLKEKSNIGGNRILLLAVKNENDDLDEVRNEVAKVMNSSVPKWNNAVRFKKKTN